MAIVKLGSGIIDISGKFGGQVFARDKTGLHIRTNTTKIKREPSPALKKQRNWYTSLKREEHKGGPPPADEEVPKDDATALIYMLNSLTFSYWGFTGTAAKVEIIPTPAVEASLYQFLDDTPEIWAHIPEMTYERAFRILLRFYGIANLVKGYTYDQAVTHACGLFAQTMARCALAITIATFFQWIMLYPEWLHVYSILAPLNNGLNTFQCPLEACIARFMGHYYIAALVARPSKRCWDFELGPRLDIFPISIQLEAIRKKYPEYIIFFDESIEQIFTNTLVHQVTLWEYARITFRTAAYQVDDTYFRTVWPHEMTPWNGAPVGWEYEGDPYAWLNQLYHAF